MYLKRLELSGFKSFHKKTLIELGSPVIAIVGPNGSGKSNVAEAIRFVLGEQSIKSLRGKLGSDLIFKGIKQGSMGRASIALVFDNSKRIFSKASQGEGINVDFDEVIISREVYGDGENKYLVNGTQVRLKDILEILAPLNIGSSGHHIISQGEADKILNASIRERKEMIEDALGLRIYQYKILESERKLERTNLNIKEGETLRRELAPHIVFLKKQVEKIEKAKEMRGELKDLYLEYFKDEAGYLARERGSLEEAQAIRRELATLDKELLRLKGELELSPEHEERGKKLSSAGEALEEIRAKKGDVERKLGRLEGMIEIEEERLKEETASKTPGLHAISFAEVEKFTGRLKDIFSKILKEGAIEAIKSLVKNANEALEEFLSNQDGEAVASRFREQVMGKMVRLKADRDTLGKSLSDLNLREKKLSGEAEEAREELEEARKSLHQKEKRSFELVQKRTELVSKVSVFSMREEKLKGEEEDFKRELAEAVALVGEAVKSHGENKEPKERALQEEKRRKIERIKIRLEDGGISSGEDTLKEYGDITQRDSFLEKEIIDLKESKKALESLIEELKEKLGNEFKDGTKKINEKFGELFKGMFGGGSASLSIVKKEKRRYRLEEDEEVLEDDEEKEFEEGLEINVSLPQKKIRDLAMLSGGERALTSIALLFAMSQVNPPPFLVLDETDAALDEANSRKYGDMLEKLSKFSELIVITHNRETMSRAGVLYGVTMDGSGASQLLSVRFEDAENYAK